MSTEDTVRALLERHGTTYAEDAGITLDDKPSPLWELLVLSLLLSARIGSDIAVAAARELSKAGYTTPQKMRDATWQQRVNALGRGHYRRGQSHEREQARNPSQRAHLSLPAITRSTSSSLRLGPRRGWRVNTATNTRRSCERASTRRSDAVSGRYQVVTGI